MRQRLYSFLTVSAALLVHSTAAQAASISVINDNGNTVIDAINLPGELDFDVIWNNNLPVWLQVDVDPADGTELAFSGGHLNLSGVDWTDFHVHLEGGPVFEEINDISPAPSSVIGAAGDPQVWLFFDPPIPDSNFLFLGDPNMTIDPEDWVIDISSIQSPQGGTFQIHLHPSTAVPEPSTFVLLGIGGVALVGYGWRRKRKSAA